MAEITIRSERFCFYYCRKGQCGDCPGERHTAMSFGSLEELCTCICHGTKLSEGTEYRVENGSNPRKAREVQ